MEREDKIMEYMMKNHESLQIKARREKKKGRSKRGMAMAHEKNLITKKLKMEKVTDEVMKMEIDTGSKDIIKISIGLSGKSVRIFKQNSNEKFL